MNDLKKLFKVIWKRFSVWIGLFAILTFMINGLSAREQTKQYQEYLTSSVANMARNLEVEAPRAGKKFDKDYIEKSDEIFEKFVKKYNIKFADQDESDFYPSVYMDDNSDIDYELMDQASQYKQVKRFLSSRTLGEEYYLKNIFAPILFFICVIGFLITSLEQSLPYYEFSTMFPWKKRDEVWMKALILFGLGLLVLLVNFIVSSLILTSSSLANIVSPPSMGSLLLKMILIMLATSILIVSTGMIAGNFLGHIGMMVVSVGGIELIWQNIRVIISVFSQDTMVNLDQGYEKFINNISLFAKPFMSILYTKTFYQSEFAYLIIAILWAILAYLVSQKLGGEKSGYMIISTSVEKIVKVLGIVSLTSLFYVILSDTILVSNNIIIDIAIYALGLLISIKLFDILFKIRLKF